MIDWQHYRDDKGVRDPDRIRSADSTYWVTRAPVMGRMTYTAAYQPQDAKVMATHLGCHDDAAAAKAACEAHRATVTEGNP